MISFAEWRRSFKHTEQVDIDTVPAHQQMDMRRYNDNLQKGATLCTNCDGTGNEFFSMYHKCPQCGGTGRKP